MNTLTAKQTLVFSVLASAALGLAFAVGWGVGHAPRPADIEAVALSRGNQHQVLVFIPPQMTSAQIVPCDNTNPGACITTVLNAINAGWKPVDINKEN